MRERIWGDPVHDRFVTGVTVTLAVSLLAPVPRKPMRLHTPARAALAAALALAALVPVSAVGAESGTVAVTDPTSAPVDDPGTSVVDPSVSAGSSAQPTAEPVAVATAGPTSVATATTAAPATPAAAPVAPAAADGTVSLDLLAVTDFHGHIERTTDSRTGALIDPGAVTLACEVAAARAENANTLFASAGDNVGATSYTSSILKDVPTMEVLDAMRLDVSAVGNHELDGGVSDLTDRIIPAVSFPYLAANVSGSTVLDAEGSGGGTFVKTVDGVRVGFVGVVTDELSTLVSPAGLSGLTISPALATANAEADALKDGDESNGEADVVVVLSHADAAFQAGAFSSSVDAVFAGHTHVPFAETLTHADGSGLAVVQADHYGSKLGHIDLSYHPATGDVTVNTAENIDLRTSSCTADAYGVAGIVSQATADAATAGNVPLARIATDFLRGANAGTDTGANRGTESTASNLLADSFASWLATDIQPGGSHYVGVMNAGGIRADLLYAASGTEGDGVVTTGEAYSVQPFGNEMGYATLTGGQLRTLLSQQFQPGGDRPVLVLGLSANMDVVLDQDVVDELAALEATIKRAADPRAEAAAQAGAVAEIRSRVISHVYVDGAELADADSVVLASNSFLLTGGDGYEVLKDVTVVNTGVLDRDVTSAYLQGFGATNPVGADYVKRQVGVAVSSSADGGVSLRMTGLVFSPDQEKTLGATSVRARVAGSELATQGIDTTSVAGHPETGQAMLGFTVPAGTVTRACTQVAATACYVVDVDLLDAQGASVSAYVVEVGAPGVVAGPSVTVSAPTVAQGSPVTFTASGFGTGGAVTFTVASEIVTVGTVATGSDGGASVTWTVPAGFEPGTHTVTATGVNGSSAQAAFTVVAGAAAGPPASSVARPGADGLAWTGTSVTIGVVAVVLVVVGIAFLVARRRRS